MAATPAEARRLGIWASALTAISFILFGRTEISFLYIYFDVRVLKLACEAAAIAPICAAFRLIALHVSGVKTCRYFTLAAFHFTRSNLTQTISFDGSQLCLFCILYPRLSACLLWLNLIKILSLFV